MFLNVNKEEYLRKFDATQLAMFEVKGLGVKSQGSREDEQALGVKIKQSLIFFLIFMSQTVKLS